MLHPFRLCFRELFLNGSVNRANACARTAVDALLGIDNILAVAFADAAYRALALARTAAYAIIGNLISHVIYLHKIYSTHIVAVNIRKIKMFLKKVRVF